MDRSHKLEAPNNEELRTIEQIEDRSGVSAVYRRASSAFEGDIMSASQREKVKAEKISSVTRDTWKSSPKIGFLLVYPFISAILLATILYTFTAGTNGGMFIGLAIVAAGFWMLTSYTAYKKIFRNLYKHGLRAGPFLLVMLISVFLGSQALFNIVTLYFAGESLLYNIVLICGLTVLYSILVAYAVLITWSNPHIKAGLKVLASAGVMVLSGLLVPLTHLL